MKKYLTDIKVEVDRSSNKAIIVLEDPFLFLFKMGYSVGPYSILKEFEEAYEGTICSSLGRAYIASTGEMKKRGDKEGVETPQIVRFRKNLNSIVGDYDEVILKINPTPLWDKFKLDQEWLREEIKWAAGLLKTDKTVIDL